MSKEELDKSISKYKKCFFELRSIIRRFDNAVAEYQKILQSTYEDLDKACYICVCNKKITKNKNVQGDVDGKRDYICTFKSEYYPSDEYVIHHGYVIEAIEAARRLARKYVPKKDLKATCTAKRLGDPTSQGLTVNVWTGK